MNDIRIRPKHRSNDNPKAGTTMNGQQKDERKENKSIFTRPNVKELIDLLE
jgi:hypothetical protein